MSKFFFFSWCCPLAAVSGVVSICRLIYMYVSCGVFVCFIYITITYAVLDIITLCRSASLYCCARFLVPPIRSTCLRSANLYRCALIETTIVSSSYVSQQFCIGVPLLRLQSHHHQYTSHNHTTILYGRKALGFRVPGLHFRGWC